ncbi:thiamine pyrophosphate-binding protein [Pseudonocardia thermophila]|uniref:thiamine pyrophosphate-binding protein n=1 Tax=Pseudonocardia thermophila TaxID=1848 RepID=UPI00248E3135|nr:thiamine pyrophosphate-binding protein [Pseudonocardia thermophila]
MAVRQYESDVTGAQVLGHALVDHELGPFFGVLGDANLDPVAHAVAAGLGYFAARHESGAVAMASGYAAATGRPGLATVSRGPALANAVTAITSAVRDRRPLIVVAGDHHTDDPHGPQSIDQAALIAPTGAGFIRPHSASELRIAVTTSIARASRDHIPVVLSIPTDLLDADATHQSDATTHDDEKPELVDPEIPTAELDLALRLLRAARAPVVLAGRGAMDAGVARDLCEIAESIGAALCTTLPAVGLFAGHPLDIGFAGGFAPASTRQRLDAADVVLVVGASLNAYTTDDGALLRAASVIHIDRDRCAFDRHRTAEIRLLGDATAVVPALRARIGRAAAQTVAASARQVGEPPAHASGSMGVDPRAALRVLDAALPQHRRVVVDVGHFSTFPCQTLRVFEPGGLLPCFGFGSVGLALPTAIGVALGRPDCAVIAVVGDGGLAMSLSELETVGRIGVPLVVAVLNDHAYGAEVHHMHARGMAADLVRFPPVPFAEIAGSLGCVALTVRTPADLENMSDCVRAMSRPVLLDIHVDPDIVADKFARRLRMRCEQTGAGL